MVPQVLVQLSPLTSKQIISHKKHCKPLMQWPRGLTGKPRTETVRNAVGLPVLHFKLHPVYSCMKSQIAHHGKQVQIAAKEPPPRVSHTRAEGWYLSDFHPSTVQHCTSSRMGIMGFFPAFFLRLRETLHASHWCFLIVSVPFFTLQKLLRKDLFGVFCLFVFNIQ